MIPIGIVNRRSVRGKDTPAGVQRSRLEGQCPGSLGHWGKAAVPAADFTTLLEIAAGPEAAVGIHVGQHPGTAAPNIPDHSFQSAGGVEDRKNPGSLQFDNNPDGPFPLRRA